MLPARRPITAPLAAGLSAFLAASALTLIGPAGSAAADGTTTTTTPVVTLPGGPTPSTTTTAPPAPPTTVAGTRPGATTTTSTTPPAKGSGVPNVPVGGPPTTAPKPGAKPAPPPDPRPILSLVDSDLDQLAAIDEYKPAQALVSQAQSAVTQAGATLLSARQGLQQAQADQSQAVRTKANADNQLRQLAIQAYIGVDYNTPGDGTSPDNGGQGTGTVSTPGGLTGVDAADAQEMLILLGQRIRQSDQDARRGVGVATKAAAAAAAQYRKAQAAVGAAEAKLLSTQQTLRLVTTAAVTPGAAAATPLPDLLSTSVDPKAGAAAPTPTTTTTLPAVTPDAANLRSAENSGVGPGQPTNPTSPNILGPSVLTGAQLAAWYASTTHQANTTVPMAQLASSYQKWGQALGVRYDLAFAQSVVETGFFGFPAGGQLTGQDNNFAGIGACDSCTHGWSFPTADTGVQAQLELLHEYATSSPWNAKYKNVIGVTGVGGCCQTWTQLAGKWASSTVYGISIMTVYQQMLAWAIPQDEVTAGLIAPTAAKALGPELAPLPGAPATTKPATSTASKSTVASASTKR